MEGFEHFVDASAVAEFLSVSRREVLRLTRSGRIPAHAVDPDRTRHDWRYRISEVSDAMTFYNPPGNSAHRKAS